MINHVVNCNGYSFTLTVQKPWSLPKIDYRHLEWRQNMLKNWKYVHFSSMYIVLDIVWFIT